MMRKNLFLVQMGTGKIGCIVRVACGVMICGAIIGGNGLVDSGAAYATESSLTLTVSSATTSVDIAPTGVNGTFKQASDTTITALTTNATGYTLSIASNDNTANRTKLVNTANTSACPTATASSTAGCYLTSIASATAASGFSAGEWGYLPSKYNSVANSNFLPAPSVAGDVIDATSTANAVANSYTLGIGAKVDNSLEVGSYVNNTFIVKLVANAIPYTITFSDGGASDMPANVISSTTETSVNISSDTPTRDGYTFIGWCPGTVTAGNPDTCSVSSLQPGAALTIDQTGGSNNFTLYAMWELAAPPAPGSCTDASTCMQTMTIAECPTTATAVTDARDGNTYKIQKLADDKCWMLDNLALDPTALTQAELYGTDDQHLTNASNTTLGYLKNGGGSSPYPATGVIAKTSSGGSWTNSYNAPYIATTDIDTVPSNAPTNGAGSNKVGVYYNYCAASAGSYCYASGSGTGNASEDLCPAGWRMPTGNTSGEFSALAYQIYGSTGSTSNTTQVNNYRNALSLPLSGYFYSVSAVDKGSSGSWWSSTRNGGHYMYILDANTGSIDPADASGRTSGYSLRCVLGS